ncbi:hypothetical protein ElyMa_006491500 [Elysia marginata]|uniref:Sulfotransferase domain-containing protein n=1 Tax=Elysia marginata TaxID=1093978 RepID=A0AAV4I1B0_9GAST|nr:hypothetical protein ElyMa_006491500 [Elysia marginata]
MNYCLKIKSLPNNPCYNTISNTLLPELFAWSNTVPPFGTRTLPDILNADIDHPKRIDDRCGNIPAPWEEHNITFELPSKKKILAKWYFDKNLLNYEKNTPLILIMRPSLMGGKEGRYM